MVCRTPEREPVCAWLGPSRSESGLATDSCHGVPVDGGRKEVIILCYGFFCSKVSIFLTVILACHSSKRRIFHLIKRLKMSTSPVKISD